MTESTTTVPIAFQGEAQFMRYSDTSRTGQTVTLALADREALESFIGLEGRRFQIVMVLLSDQETPEKVPAKPIGPLCGEAVAFCARTEFQKWITEGTEFALSKAGADLALKAQLGMKTRRELDEDPAKANAWRNLKAAYYRHNPLEM